MHHNPPINSKHAKAVLMMTSILAEEGCVIITSNTDEQADPQIFAQNQEMLFSFFFIRADPDSLPERETMDKWQRIAAHHQVEPYYIPVNTDNGTFDIIPLADITFSDSSYDPNHKTQDGPPGRLPKAAQSTALQT